MVNKLKRQLFFLICISVLAVSWVSADEYNGTMDLLNPRQFSSPILIIPSDTQFFQELGRGVFFGASHGKGKVYKLGKVVGALN